MDSVSLINIFFKGVSIMIATPMRRDLKDFHLTDKDITTLVEKSKSPNLYSNPVEVTDEFLYQMYHDMR